MAVSLDYSQFHQVFPPKAESPYSQPLIKEIEGKRKSLGGILFIDRVLKALGITKAKIYPPKGDNGLHALHQQICAAKMSPHQKISVLYYMLLDYDEDAANPRLQIAETFARRTGLPKKYQIFMKGLWYMDRLRLNVALEHLSHPSLQPEFADDIITALIRHAENNDYSLALAYFHSVKPVLKSSQALELVFGAIARTSVTEAFYLSRTYPDPARKPLFQQLISSVLNGTGSQDIGTRAADLVSLPFDDAEEEWFDEFLTTGGGRGSKKAKDTLVMRKILLGQQRELGDKNLSTQWGTVLQGLKVGMGGRTEE